MPTFHDLNQRDVSHTLQFTPSARHDKQQQTRIKKENKIKSLPTLCCSLHGCQGVLFTIGVRALRCRKAAKSMRQFLSMLNGANQAQAKIQKRTRSSRSDICLP